MEPACSLPQSDQSSPPPIALSEDPPKYYAPIHAWVFQAVSFPQVSPPKPYINLSSPPTPAKCCGVSNLHTVHTAHDAAPQDHSQPQPTHPGGTPLAVGHGLILLMMGIMMPETCWDRKLDNKHRIICILLVLSLHLMFTMHGHKNLNLWSPCWHRTKLCTANKLCQFTLTYISSTLFTP